MRKFAIFTMIAVFFCGCMIKTNVNPATMYEIYYQKNECVAKKSNKSIYLEGVKALDIVDNRQILIISERNFIRYLTDAKYVALPSEMFYKSLIKGIYQNCHASPVFSPKNNDLVLKVELISLQIRGDQAEVSLAYELKQGEKNLKSGFVSKQIFCPDPSSVTVFNSINMVSNMAIDEFLSQILD